MTISEIKNMTTIERLRAMEDLWNVLCDSDEVINSPDWHGEVLKERRSKIESGQAEFISISKLKSSFHK